MLDLIISDHSKKSLSQIKISNFKSLNLILSKSEDLRKNPLLIGSKKLKGYQNIYRVKVQKIYRIIYEFDNENLTILLVDVRSRAYKVLERIKDQINLYEYKANQRNPNQKHA